GKAAKVRGRDRRVDAGGAPGGEHRRGGGGRAGDRHRPHGRVVGPARGQPVREGAQVRGAEPDRRRLGGGLEPAERPAGRCSPTCHGSPTGRGSAAHGSPTGRGGTATRGGLVAVGARVHGAPGNSARSTSPPTGTTNRRSRNRLPRSHVVSETNRHTWHAAPCRKSAGSCGSRSAHSGSEEHRSASVSARRVSSTSRSGSASDARPPSVPSASGTAV